MGVDSRPGMYVSAETIRRWKRTCKFCGKTETTQRTKKSFTTSGIAGCACEKEEPAF